MSDTDVDLVYKILLLGDSTVGKSCFLMRYSENIFMENYVTTIGLDYKLKYIDLESGKRIKVQLWDTAGEERFRTIAKNYFKGSHGILLLYDVTNLKTFQGVKEWINQIRQEVSNKTIIFLIGNKIDLNDQITVSTDEGRKVAEENCLPFYEASAKTGENIDNIFNDLYKKIGQNYIDSDSNEARGGQKLGKSPKKRKKCCK